MIIDLGPIYSSRQAGEGFGDEEFLAGLSGIGMLVDSTSNNAAYIDEGGMIAAAGFNGSLDSGTQDFYLADKNAGGIS